MRHVKITDRHGSDKLTLDLDDGLGLDDGLSLVDGFKGGKVLDGLRGSTCARSFSNGV